MSASAHGQKQHNCVETRRERTEWAPRGSPSSHCIRKENKQMIIAGPGIAIHRPRLPPGERTGRSRITTPPLTLACPPRTPCTSGRWIPASLSAECSALEPPSSVVMLSCCPEVTTSAALSSSCTRSIRAHRPKGLRSRSRRVTRLTQRAGLASPQGAGIVDG